MVGPEISGGGTDLPSQFAEGKPFSKRAGGGGLPNRSFSCGGREGGELTRSFRGVLSWRGLSGSRTWWRVVRCRERVEGWSFGVWREEEGGGTILFREFEVSSWSRKFFIYCLRARKVALINASRTGSGKPRNPPRDSPQTETVEKTFVKLSGGGGGVEKP